MPSMTIFMSWSGNRSRAFAEQLKPWLEQVLPGTEVWLSSDDIDKGTIWFTEIIESLKNCHCGVVCVTRENHLSPWLHFEAGGLAKGLGKSHVAVIALDLDYHELKQPLGLFNALRLNRDGAWHLVKSFNKLCPNPIKDRVLERTFEKFWPDLDQAFREYFPESHQSALQAEPLHIVPKPTDNVFGSQAKPKRRRHKADETSEEKMQPKLFNGGSE